MECGTKATLAWEPHFQHGHEQFTPVFDGTHDPVDLQAVATVVYLNRIATAAAFKPKSWIFLPLLFAMEAPDGEIAVVPGLCKSSIHSNQCHPFHYSEILFYETVHPRK